jgi:hypothetical protein
MDNTQGKSGISLASMPGMDQVRGAVEGLAQDKLSLDVVEIRQDPKKGTILAAGRYVTSQLFLGFLQPLDFSSSNSASDHSATTSCPRRKSSTRPIAGSFFGWKAERARFGSSSARATHTSGPGLATRCVAGASGRTADAPRALAWAQKAPVDVPRAPWSPR